MHIEPLTPEHRGTCRVWLEVGGLRAFVHEGTSVPGLAALQEWVAKSRHVVERAWLEHMKAKGWLRVEAHGAGIWVVAYPGATTEVKRWVGFQGCPGWLSNDDVEVEAADLVIGAMHAPQEQVRMFLPSVIWEGEDDGSDAPRLGKRGGLGLPTQLVQDRLARISAIAQRLLTRVRVRPDLPAAAPEVIEALKQIIETARSE